MKYMYLVQILDFEECDSIELYDKERDAKKRKILIDSMVDLFYELSNSERYKFAESIEKVIGINLCHVQSVSITKIEVK